MINMKLNGFVFVACILGVQFSFAQKLAEAGIKAGYNYSDLDLSKDGRLYATKYHAGSGYHVGGYALIELKKKLSVQPELIYSNQNQYFSTPYFSNLKTTLNYINIPVMFKYYLTGSLNVQVGPQLGILASSTGDLVQVQNGFFVGQPVTNQSLSSYLKSTDFSVAFGAGINLPGNLNLGVRYTVGVTDINENSGGATFPGGLQPSFSTAFTRNQVLQVSIGYALHKFGKK
jgi:hypothetical protein